MKTFKSFLLRPLSWVQYKDSPRLCRGLEYAQAKTSPSPSGRGGWGVRASHGRGFATILLFVCLLLTGCYNEEGVETLSTKERDVQVVMTFTSVAQSNSTRADAIPNYEDDINNPNAYEVGLEEENYVDISGGDYKIYFFSYTPDATTDPGTLIATFTPTDVTSTTDTDGIITYTVTGSVPSSLLEVSNFRIVVLANYGLWYPSVTEGTTTIDDLVEGSYTTFSASSKFVIDESNHIPFYGVQEYTDIEFQAGKTTTLTTPISLLRSVAKVEVIACVEQTNGDDSTASSYGGEYFTFSDVSIVRYNATGYCAPAGVYTADDYDTQMKNNPSSGNWADEWVKDLHLYGSANDTESKTQLFTKVYEYGEYIGDPLETWRIYLPEYDNIPDYSSGADDDCCSISVTIGDDSTGEVVPTDKTYNIYFAQYDENGKTDNEVVTNRLNIKRNNIYRFYVTLGDNGVTIRVYVIPWTRMDEEAFTL